MNRTNRIKLPIKLSAPRGQRLKIHTSIHRKMLNVILRSFRERHTGLFQGRQFYNIFLEAFLCEIEKWDKNDDDF